MKVFWNIQFLILIFLSGIVAEPPQSQIDEYIEAITTFREEAEKWIPPKDYSSRVNGYNQSSGCVNRIRTIYDFIIIGGGSAGTVLANRLSEIAKWKILLLETGGTENIVTDIPGMALVLPSSNLNFGFYSTPLKGFAAYVNRSVAIPRAAVLGGSSVINYMMYVRGNKEDYNTWGGMGNPGWSYDEALPYFMKSEHVSFPNASAKYHGIKGPLNVQKGRYFDDLGQAILDGQAEFGREINSDYNAEEQLGCSIGQMTQINGRRDSGAKAFISSIRDRRNLHISLGSFVLKILIRPKSKKAYGVEFVRNGQCYSVRAKKEIILSAGAINSPQILMLSGVGPAWHLKELDIPVLMNLPTGENLWSHPTCSLSYFVNYTYENSSLKSQIRDFLKGEGYLTVADGNEGISFFNSTDANGTVPDIEQLFYVLLPSDMSKQVAYNLFGVNDEGYEAIYEPQNNKTYIKTTSVLLHPKSRGCIRLKYSSPIEFPLIDLNLFANANDVEVLLTGIRDTERIMKSTPMQKYNPQEINVTLSICKEFEHGSDDYWKCIIRNAGLHLHHFGGTCKMGPSCDPEAVVDERLHVRGIKKLRVVDCSVMPNTMSGHTNALAFMIAEKASDIIKEDYSNDYT